MIIYAPGTGDPDKDHFRTIITLNDSDYVPLKKNAEYLLKLTSEGTHTIMAERNKVTVDAKFGHNYYVRLFIKPKRSSLQIIDDNEGELESSLIGKNGKNLKHRH